MSQNNENKNKQKNFVFPKQPNKNIKSFDNSSKSTTATNKNIIAKKSLKVFDKVDYFNLYSDLIYSHQDNCNFNKKNPKEDSEESLNSSSFNFEKIVVKKNKKCYSNKISKIKHIKYFKEDGEVFSFPLFNEREIKIDQYDNKVKIESAEDDFESDESTLDYGKKKVEKDLIEAFSLIQKENINCIINYKKYQKYMKKPKKN